MPLDPGGPTSGTGTAVSAVPQDLIAYSKQGVAHAQTLLGTGKRLESDLDAFVASRPDPAIMRQPIPYLGSELQRYATVKRTTDEWVGKVGLAFEEAGAARLGSDLFSQPGMAVSSTADQIDALVARDDRTPGQGKALADQIEKVVQDSSDRELSTSEIGKIIMRRLKALDKVAYVRFASVYLEFEDVTEFMSELKNLVRSRVPRPKAKRPKPKGNRKR